MPITENLVMPKKLIEGDSAWYGSDMRSSTNWVKEFSRHEKLELSAAMQSIKERKIKITEIKKADFILPTLRKKFEIIQKELLEGRGFTLLRGLEVDKYSIEESAIIYTGIGVHFGHALPQNAKGHIIGHIKDVGLDHRDPKVRVYQTNVRQTYHTDSCDLVFLLCLKTAKSGGLSSIVSSVTIFNEMFKKRPDLADALFEPIETDRRGEIPPGQLGYYRMPIFNWFKGRLSTLYTRRYIESARRFSKVPALTDIQTQALNMLDQLANNSSINLYMEFKPGDIQILHNHQILHDRTDFKDWQEEERKRHLLRLWVASPNGRPLPPIFAERYGSVEIGSPERGGVRVVGQKLTAPLTP
ncbi:TauD/TfdA family dioxygenase [Candidatus Puniceispirillum sp.]|nr:TauD/TfdA family dioxygenase [Candidatus Puniceispirillum sp.]